MVRSIRRGAMVVTCIAMMCARNRLLRNCSAFVLPTAAGRKMRVNKNRGMIASSTQRHRSTTAPSPGSAPRSAPGLLAARFFDQSQSFSAAAGGSSPGGEPSSPWTNLRDESKSPPTPVSVDEYVALGPRYRYQQGRQHRRRRRETEDDWVVAATDLAASLGLDPATTTDEEHRRIFHLYLPVYFWLLDLLHASSLRSQRRSPSPSSSSSSPTLVVGVSAPQGCGKTTLVSEMQRMLKSAGHSCAVVSIDDFYLTGAEQVSQDALAARYPTNPLLQVRGNPGTHDLGLGLRTIRALTSLDSCRGDKTGLSSGPASTAAAAAAETARKAEREVAVPRYDKSARGGKGDRAPESEWEVVTTRPDVVLLEGWMLGFEALPADSPLLSAAMETEGGLDSGGLGIVNNFLEDYHELYDEVEAWLVLKATEPEMVFEWRAEAERRMREAGRPGMSEEEVRDFCSRYMPAYRAYLPGLYDRSSGRAAAENGGGCGRDSQTEEEALDGKSLTTVEKTLVVEVGRDRNPVH